MNKKPGILSLRRLLLAVAVALPAVSLAATQAGTVLLATAGVKAIAADGSVRELGRRSPIFSGDRLVTGAGARVQVKFSDGSIMALRPNTELSVDKYVYEPQGAQAMLMSLVKGGFRTVTGAVGRVNRADYRIDTPVATLGIRGTLHEADFNPQSGLALAVWDGGTEACNSKGCLELGTGADYRFGFIALDGQQQGLTLPPAGVGGDDGIAGDDHGLDDETDEFEFERERELADDDRGLFVDDANAFLAGAHSNYSGFAVVGGPLGSATQYPWGTKTLLEVLEAKIERDSVSGAITGWSLQSKDAGGFINPGYTGGSFSGQLPPAPSFLDAPDGTALLVWGTWAGVDSLLDYGDVSVSGAAGVAGSTGIPAAGFYAFATTQAPEVIANLTGQVNFELLYSANTPSGSFPQFFDASSASVQYASAAGGQMQIDVASGNASGTLDFTTAQNGDMWHLVMDGRLANAGLDLQVVDGNDGSLVGSWYRPVDSTAGSELGVTGTVDVEFVGSATNPGLLGGFDIETRDSADGNFATGIFYMTEVQLPSFTGFAALGGDGSAYQWGSASLLTLDDARLLFGLDSLGNTVVLDGSMYSSTAGNKFILPGRLNPDLVSASYPPDDPFWMSLASDPAVRIAWGAWLGGDMSLSNVDNGIWTTDAIVDPGTFIFGDWASPTVIANMTGAVDFTLLPQFPLFVDAAGVPQVAVNPSGNMTVDVASGSVGGNLAFTTSSADQWALVFNGNFNAQAAQPLSLAVLSDPVSPANASHFLASAGAGAPLEVGGTIQASFIGLTDVAGLVGAFDVQTTDTGDANFARGVFGMEVTQPLP